MWKMGSRIFFRSALILILLNTGLFVAAKNEADDFSNNLFTDLAPLLGLFGEQFTKQFLSESFSFRERILFAMAPLGVVTAIVGAIRVGGAKWLKRLIGRARENFADVEIELMSSVSKEVCELWDGTSIVRSRGNPQIKQIIHVPAEDGDVSPESFITVDPDTWSKGSDKYRLTAGDRIYEHTNSRIPAKESHERPSESPPENANFNHKDRNVDVEAQTLQNTGHLSDEKAPPSNSMLDEQKPKDTAGEDNKDMPPNISLNIHNGSNSIEVTICAVVAIGLQVGVLVWSWRAKEQKWSALKPVVGFWLQAIGTVVLALSLIVCAGIIDNGSCERRWSSKRSMSGVPRYQFLIEKPSRGEGMQLYWLQKQHTAGDNNFDSYILYAKKPNDHVLESRRCQSYRATRGYQTKHNQKSNKNMLGFSLFPRRSVQHLTTFAVILGISGFVVQFQGLRFSNWTCAVSQLTALVFATCLRALVRRNMSKTPGAVPVENEYLLDHLTLAIIGNGSNGPKSSISEGLHSPGLSIAFGVTNIPKLRDMTSSQSREPSREAKERLNLAKQALDLRVRLGQITKWAGAKSQEAVILSNAIETTLERLDPQLLMDKKCAVVLQVNTCRNRPDVPPNSESTVQEEIELMIVRDGKEWKVDDAQLEALLSLLSFSFWATKQNRKNQGEIDEEKRLSRSESSGHGTERQIVDNNQSIGWLRAKTPDSQKFERIVGKSSPRLISDLSWWTTTEMHELKAVNIIDGLRENSVFAISTSSSSGSEANCDKIIKSPVLGFYADTQTSEESNIFVSSICTERQIFVLHLFSAFIWAVAEHVSVQKFHPASVHAISQASSASPTSFRDIVSTFRSSGQDNPYQIKSDKIEKLVQELQRMGLATSEGIYRVLIPPLSHFDKLPNEAMADWSDERFKITREQRMNASNKFVGCRFLIRAVQGREVQDRFAHRTAAIMVGFLFRRHEDPPAWTPGRDGRCLKKFNKDLREFMKNENKTFSISILSLRPILKRQGKIERLNETLRRLNLEDFLLGLPHSDKASDKPDFTFPNDTDVFGWTERYWKLFDGYIFSQNWFETLDLAGRSVLHNAIDSLEDDVQTGFDRFSSVLDGFSKHQLLQDEELLTAQCDKQTPLHRAARTGQIDVVKRLVDVGIDPNAADIFGRTALCFAVHQGKTSVIELLCEKMKGGLDQKDHNGRNALVYAILNHQEDAALILIQRKIQFNEQDRKRRTPLWYAAREGMGKVVKALLNEDKIEVNVQGLSEHNDGSWTSAKIEATMSGHRKIVEMVEDWDDSRLTLLPPPEH